MINGDVLAWSLVRYLTVQSMSPTGVADPRSSLPADDREDIIRCLLAI